MTSIFLGNQFVERQLVGRGNKQARVKTSYEEMGVKVLGNVSVLKQ